MSDELKRLADAVEGLERQAGELRAEVARLAEAEAGRLVAERERAAAEAERAAFAHPLEAGGSAPHDPTRAEPGDDDAEARIVAYSMVLDGRPRDEVARHLAEELGITDSDALLDDLYARAEG